jgi:hypothetical protein
MPTTWVVAIISTVGLLATVLLLRAEEKAGHRIVLRRARAACDLLFLKLGAYSRKMWRRVGGNFLRRSFHFLINRFLRLLIIVVRAVESVLKKLQRTNQQVARTTIPNSETHLGEVREHTSALRMSPEEKRQKRRELLE